MTVSRVERNSVHRWAGYPVPWFVNIDARGVPDFRVVNTARMMRADRYRLCMLCGEPLGAYNAFVIGPMCAVNRVSSEPPSHRECCEYAVTTCPFLSDPERQRREGFKEPMVSAAGLGIRRNPGVSAVWSTKRSERFQAWEGKAGYLWRLGEPTSISWWCRGRQATRDEVMESINSGMPLLEELADKEGRNAQLALRGAYRTALGLIPLDEAGSQAA